MNECLYHPEWGYYASGPPPIGKRGDFFTGPHASSLFGALLANQVAECLDMLRTDSLTVVEMGAGTGVLAADMLASLLKADRFSGLRYVIVEPFAPAVPFQREMLERFAPHVSWVGSIDEISPGPCCFVSNELPDAFPVHVVERHGDSFKEIHVRLDPEGRFTECLRESEGEVASYVKGLPGTLPEGYRTEVNIAMKSWISGLGRLMTRGFVITVDYGFTASEYFHPSRNRGTLLAYRDHAVSEDMFFFPGGQDMTSHVNFSDLHRWGMESGFVTLGYAPQWAFLASLDVERTFMEMTGGTFDPFSPALAGVKMLLFPQGMGDSHKVLVQAKGIDPGVRLRGFTLKNRKDRL